MATATEKAYVVARLDELEPAPLLRPTQRTTDGSASTSGVALAYLVRHQRVPGAERGRRHPRARRDASRRRRAGGALHRPERHGDVRDRRRHRGGTSRLAGPRAPDGKRKATAKDDGTTILAIGGTPGKAYEPAPEEAKPSRPTTRVTTRPPPPSSWSSSRSGRTTPWRPSTPPASRHGPDRPTRRSSICAGPSS